MQAETNPVQAALGILAGSLLIGITILEFVERVLVRKNLDITLLAHVDFIHARVYFSATVLLGVVVLVTSLISDLLSLRSRDVLKGGILTGHRMAYSIRLSASLKLVFWGILCIFWAQLVHLNWFSALNFVFELPQTLALGLLLIPLTWVILFFMVVFEPWVPILDACLPKLEPDQIRRIVIRSTLYFMIRAVIYLMTVLMIFTFTYPMGSDDPLRLAWLSVLIVILAVLMVLAGRWKRLNR